MVVGALALEKWQLHWDLSDGRAKHSVFGVGGGKGEFPGKGNIFKGLESRLFSKLEWEAGNSGKKWEWRKKQEPENEGPCKPCQGFWSLSWEQSGAIEGLYVRGGGDPSYPALGPMDLTKQKTGSRSSLFRIKCTKRATKFFKENLGYISYTGKYLVESDSLHISVWLIRPTCSATALKAGRALVNLG